MSVFSRLLAAAPSALAALLLTASAAVVAPGHARAQAGNNIQVLAMLEDADPRSVVRTSNIAKRVTAELKRSLQDQGFRMVDEEMIAADLGWTIAVRRPKLELIQAMNMANTSNKRRAACPRPGDLLHLRRARAAQFRQPHPGPRGRRAL